MAGFDTETLAVLDGTDEVEVETSRGRRIIWVVVDNGLPYIRSVRGASGLWYRAASGEPTIHLHAQGRAVSARPVAVTDEAEIGRVSAAIERKYRSRWPGPTDAMLRPEVLETTLRLEPA